MLFYNTPKILEIDLQPPYQEKRSIQILIHGATFTEAVMEICKSYYSKEEIGGGVLSPYCMIYALDKNGKKITPKNTVFSTSVYALKHGDASPIWNEQFDLFCRDIITRFDSVRIKIKVHRSGFIRDRNLGTKK